MLKEMLAEYKGTYTKKEVQSYWDKECKEPKAAKGNADSKAKAKAGDEESGSKVRTGKDGGAMTLAKLKSYSKNKIENNDKRLKQIHMFNYKYNIDNKIFKELPSNIYCDKFSIENIFVSIPKNILKNISQVFHSCDLEIDKFISSS